ncbi:hypothetical protein DITRI_Ditri13aG0090300 [Diplodiscus trichospermus]
MHRRISGVLLQELAQTVGVALVEVLKTCTYLKKLDLCDNMFGVEAGVALKALANALKDSAASLEVLEMARNDITVKGQLNEVDVSTNAIRRVGARLLAQVVVKKPGFKLLNINGNFISDEGIDEVKELFKSSPNMLGSLDENDPEGDDDEEEEQDEGEEEKKAENENELESKLKDLKIEQGE